MKVKPTRDNVFKREPYRSILNLLIKYPDGLEPKHLRFALCKNHDEDKFNIKTYRYLEGFFMERKDNVFKLEYLMKSNYIVEGCIKSKHILSNFLKNMVDIEVIHLSDESKHIYKISGDVALIGYRLMNKDVFDCYNNVMVRNIDDISSHLLYGFSNGLYGLLPKDDKDKIDTYLKEIHDKLIAIEMIKVKQIHDWIHREIIPRVHYTSKDNPHLDALLTSIYSCFSMLIFTDTFEIPHQKHKDKPKGIPFEVNKDSNLSSYLIELRHNIIYHWNDIVRWVELTPEEGERLFDEVREHLRRIEEIYDVNCISYSFCSRGAESKAIRDISKGKLISLIQDVERKKTH